MSKPVKWVLIFVGALVLLLIAAIIVIPLVIDVNKYKPQIEALASKQIGRPLTIGGQIKPSIFPWIGVSVQDIRLGNTKAFAEKDFVTVGEIEVRVKLLPILSGRYEIKRFVIKGAHITLIKNKDGQLNTQGLGPAEENPAKTTEKPETGTTKSAELPIKDLEAQEIALENCSVAWIDHATGQNKQVTNINLALRHVSLLNPIQVEFSAVADGHPIALDGQVGPLGRSPGKDPLDLDLTAKLLERVAVHLKGRVENPAKNPAFNLALTVDPFSPRELLAGLNQPLPFEPADKKVLENLSLECQVAGTPDRVSVSKGVLHLDQTKMEFNAQAKEFARPDLTLAASLDALDMDRYLPAPAKEKSAPKEAPAPKAAKKTDYTPLRKLILDAHLRAKAVTIRNSRLQNIEIKATARNGIFHLDPLSMELFQGKLAATGQLDVRREQPETQFNLDLGGVQAEPLVKNVLNKEWIQGVLNGAVHLNFTGDQADLVRKTLAGKGELTFKDGAIIGIDLADMVRNVETAFGLAEKTGQKPRTDFSELLVAFSADKGLVKIDPAKLSSPLLRLDADGNVDLSREKLDLRVNPKFVATLVGQGDTRQRSGVMVPVLVKGTFQKPKFEPDLKALITQSLPGKENISKEIEGAKKKVTEDLEKKTQELLKGLPFGPKK